MRKAGGETAKEVCNRASNARCAGVPNLGSIGVDVEDFLPQLCGGSGGQTLRGDGVAQMPDLQRTSTLQTPMTVPASYSMKQWLVCDLQWRCDFSRASSASLSPSSSRQPGRLAAQ